MPKLSVHQYAKVLLAATQTAEKEDVSVIVNNFLNFLKNKFALKKLSAILAVFEEEVKKQQGEIKILVTSARDLSEQAKKVIMSNLGQKVVMDINIDPSLIGGAKIKTENTILDASVKGQLSKLKLSL